MNKLLVSLLLIVLPLIAIRAQDTERSWRIFSDSTLADAVRIQTLNELSENLVKKQPDSLLLLADFAMERALMEKKPLLEAYALRLKGDYYFDNYDFDSALGYFFSGLEILEKHQYKGDMGMLFERIGSTYLRGHNYLKAQEFSQKSLDIYIELGDSLGMAVAYKDLGVNFYFQGDFMSALQYFQIARELFTIMGEKQENANMASRLGAMYYHQGHYTLAIQYFNEYLDYYKNTNELSTQSEAYTNLGAVYFQLNDFERAREYYRKGLAIDEEFGQHRGSAIGYYNIGESYLVQKDYVTAMEHFQKSMEMSLEYNLRDVEADCYLAIGLIQKNLMEYQAALTYYQRSLEAAREIGYNAIISAIHTSRGNLYNELYDHKKALEDCQLSLKASRETGDIKEQIDACKCLYETHKLLGNPEKALENHEMFLLLTDSLHEEETIRELQKMEFERQMLEDSLKVEEEKLLAEITAQKEISKQRSRKNIFLFSSIGVFIMSIGLYSRLSYIRKSRTILQKEKERSENLLLNILPGEVAEELKLKGESVARNFDDVTVLFTDFKEFTSISESLNAQELVAEINTCFKAFDQIITAYKIEKIKTIGDAYMAAGGLHLSKISTAKDVVLAALEMQAFMESRKLELQEKGKPYFEMRVGIHTGQVVAGIVGVKKFQYDIWGDTVNIASRMESSGEVGCVNISESTYSSIKDDPEFSFIPRGKINAKHKGMLEMYFVSRKS